MSKRAPKPSRRLGKIFIPHSMYEQSYQDTEDLIVGLKLVPYRAESLYHRHGIEIIGSSPRFEPLEETAKVPEYTVTMTRERGDGPLEIIDVSKSEHPWP